MSQERGNQRERRKKLNQIKYIIAKYWKVCTKPSVIIKVLMNRLLFPWLDLKAAIFAKKSSS